MSSAATLCLTLALLWAVFLGPLLFIGRLWLGQSLLTLYTWTLIQITHILFETQDFVYYYNAHLLPYSSFIVTWVQRKVAFVDHRILGLSKIKGREYALPSPHYARCYSALVAHQDPTFHNLQQRIVPTWMTRAASDKTWSQEQSIHDWDPAKLRITFIHKLLLEDSKLYLYNNMGKSSRLTFWDPRIGSDTLDHLVAMRFTHSMLNINPDRNQKRKQKVQDSTVPVQTKHSLLASSFLDANYTKDESYQESIELIPMLQKHNEAQHDTDLDTENLKQRVRRRPSIHDTSLSDSDVSYHHQTHIQRNIDDDVDENDDGDSTRSFHPTQAFIDKLDNSSSHGHDRLATIMAPLHVYKSEARNTSEDIDTLSPTSKKFKELETKWLNVGTKIGLRLLSADPLQQNNVSPASTHSNSTSIGMIQKGKNRFDEARNQNLDPNIEDEDDSSLSMPKVGFLDFDDERQLASPVNVPLIKPTHSLWTSPSRGYGRSLSNSSFDFVGEAQSSFLGAQKTVARNESKVQYQNPSSYFHSSTPSPMDPQRLVQSSTHNSLKSRNTTQIPFSVIRSKPTHAFSRSALLPGVKMVVPIFPISISQLKPFGRCYYQMSTVLSSKRIFVADFADTFGITNCLEIRVLLDKSFLRNAKYAEMTVRVFDRELIPRHSKFPIGSCVATSFGIGVLVGWRVEDDCHIVRSLWKKRGAGSARAFLNRDSIHAVVEAATGFSVETTRGYGRIIGYIQGGRDFCSGLFLVQIKTSGKYSPVASLLSRSDILSCKGAQFLPIIEQIRESANYLIQLDNYESSKVLLLLENESAFVDKTLRVFSEGFELLITSFMKAIEEDEQLHNDFKAILSSIISFLENFDMENSALSGHRQRIDTHGSSKKVDERDGLEVETSIVYRLFGDAVKKSRKPLSAHNLTDGAIHEPRQDMFLLLKLAMRTVIIARASCSDRPNLHLSLSILYEILLFIRTVVKVQRANMSQISIAAWDVTFSELISMFGPINNRLHKIAQGIAERLAVHGQVAKMRALQFIDIVACDDHLLDMLEEGEYVQCIHRIEFAVVQANILQEETLIQYRKALLFLYDNIAPKLKSHGKGTGRSGKKFSFLARLVRLLATPRRSFLKYLTKDDVLDIVERIFIRIFQRQDQASQMISIFSFNFRSFRQLRILSNIAISGKLLLPILDAADEEFAWMVSRTPTQTKDFLTPLSKLFSLGVAHFHQIQKSDTIGDWLDFLLEDDAVRMIQQLDRSLMLYVQGLCHDIREIMDILPYYSSIDDDILNLVDNVDIESELKDAAEALLDEKLFDRYLKEKSFLIVTKFLDYLPRISIPIERREIGEGWCVSCRGRGGEDLKLSNVVIEKENVVCRILGSINVILPVSLEDKTEREATLITSMSKDWDETDAVGNVEVSILNHIGELIRNAQSHGYYNVGIGGVCDSSTDMSLSPLDGLPLSQVLRCAIELWKNLEMDDDELLEIAIRDIAYQIELSHSLENSGGQFQKDGKGLHRLNCNNIHPPKSSKDDNASKDALSSLLKKRRFNPRKDPTLLYFEIAKLTCSLDDFAYRIEMLEPRSIFDPVFVGIGSLVIKNASIMLRVECRKDRVVTKFVDRIVPKLHLQEFDVRIEKVLLSFKETGADWLLNSLVSNFSDSITATVRLHLKHQILKTINATITSMNSYLETNPDVILKLLGISIDDLEMNTAWV